MNSSLWKTVLGEIELSVSHAAFLTWFTKTELIEQSPDGKVVISVPNVFAKQQFEVKFNKQIKQILKKNGVEENENSQCLSSLYFGRNRPCLQVSIPNPKPQ